jgi:hypothetical protein
MLKAKRIVKIWISRLDYSHQLGMNLLNDEHVEI